MSDKNKIKDGGPAFPVGFREFDQRVHGKAPYLGLAGMSLRDYFAAAALQGMIAGSRGLHIPIEDFSKHSYKHADAMLKEREK